MFIDKFFIFNFSFKIHHSIKNPSNKYTMPTTPRILNVGEKVKFVPEFMDRLREEINKNISIDLSRSFFIVKSKNDATRTVVFKSGYINTSKPEQERKREFEWSYDDPIVKSDEDKSNIDSILRDIRRICKCVHADASHESMNHNLTEALDVFAGMDKEIQDIIKDSLKHIKHKDITGNNVEFRCDVLDNLKLVAGIGMHLRENKKGHCGYIYQAPTADDILNAMFFS